jgi:transposase
LVEIVGCWAHLRRRFYELHINGSSQIATQTITTMAGLWKIEEEIRGCDAAVRLTARRDRSAAIVDDLFKLWETELPHCRGSRESQNWPRRSATPPPTGDSRALPPRRPYRNR